MKKDFKKDIDNKNDKGEWHGYNEWYMNNKLFYRGNYKNDKPVAYEESHSFPVTNFYIK